jgi:hypothetical protein
MRNKILDSKVLVSESDCFGSYDPDDAICQKWCQLSIRCAIAQHQHEELEILENLFEAEFESDRVQ